MCYYFLPVFYILIILHPSREIGQCFEKLADDKDCRAVVLSASGRIFTAGIDLNDLAEMAGIVMNDDDLARKSRVLRKIIAAYQQSFTSLEKVRSFQISFLSLLPYLDTTLDHR